MPRLGPILDETVQVDLRIVADRPVNITISGSSNVTLEYVGTTDDEVDDEDLDDDKPQMSGT